MSKVKLPYWTNSPLLERIEVAFLFMAWLFLAWLLTGVTGEENRLTGIFFGMMTIAGVAYAGKNSIALQTVGFGKKNNVALLGAGAGLVFGVFLNASNFAVFNPLATVGTVLGFSTVWLFSGFVAPIVEEAFFRGTLQPTFSEWFNNANVGVVLQAIAFSGFHFWVSQYNPTILVMSLFFGLVVGFVNLYLKSTTFGYSSHLINNLLALRILG